MLTVLVALVLLDTRLVDLRIGYPHANAVFHASAEIVGQQPPRVMCPGATVRYLSGGGPSLRGTGEIVNGRARCAWKLPRGTTGGYFRGAVIVPRPGGGTDKLSFWHRIG
jgi:hypothetical protein